jgi:aminoglycoside phosphotransferase (APT) family kinase protein
MSFPQLDQQAQIETVASRIFARHGIDFAAARRAEGWSNATWIAGGLALRIATRQGSENIRREARLAQLLPAEVGYPPRVDSGVSDGLEWCLSKEIPGRCLGDVWPELGWEERAAALRGMWRKAQAVHAVALAPAACLAGRRAWFNTTDAAEASASLARLEQQGMFTSTQVDALRTALDRFWLALPAADCVLNHGDLTLANAIWDAGQVVSLLDFEYAVIAPAELDINIWLTHAFGPEDTGLAAHEQAGQAMLRDLAVRLAQPALDHPGGPELLLGYAILLELCRLELWLLHPEGEGPLAGWEPYLRLGSLADGEGGYLKLFVEGAH